MEKGYILTAVGGVESEWVWWYGLVGYGHGHKKKRDMLFTYLFVQENVFISVISF